MISKILYNLSMSLGYKNPEIPAYKTVPKQKDWMRISAADIRQILLDSTNVEIKCAFNNADASYKLVNIDNLKMFVAKNNLSKLIYEPEKLDCIAGNTPLWIKKGDSIKLIETKDLFENYDSYENILIYTQHGFTELFDVIKKSKPCDTIRLLTNTDIEVTPNHEFITSDGTIEAIYSNIDNRIISYPELPITTYGDYNLGWAHGFFMAEGSAIIRKHGGYNGATWNLRCGDIEYLEYIRDTYNKYYTGFEFYIKSYESERKGLQTNFGTRNKSIHHLLCKPTKRNNDGSKGKFVFKFRDMFYNKYGIRKIPDEILHGNDDIIVGFLDGLTAGNGHDGNDITASSKLQTIGIAYLYNKIGIDVSIRDDHGSSRIHHLKIGHTPHSKTQYVESVTQNVYDLKTANHEFIAGNIAVHNCDDFSFILQGDISRYDSDLAVGIVWGVTPQGHGHSWLWCIGTDKQLWFIESQSNHVFKPEKLWKITLLLM